MKTNFLKKIFSSKCIVMTVLAVLLSTCAIGEETWDQLYWKAYRYWQDSRFSESLTAAQESLKKAEGEKEPKLEQISQSLSLIAMIYNYQGKMAEAEPYAKRALEAAEKINPEDPQLSGGYFDLGNAQMKLSNFNQAEIYFRKALEIDKAHDSNNTGNDFYMLANALFKQGKYAEAEINYREYMNFSKEKFGSENLNVAQGTARLAIVCDLQDKNEEAQTYYKDALKALDQPDCQSEVLEDLLDHYAHFLEKKGETKEAKIMSDRAADIRKKRASF